MVHKHPEQCLVFIPTENAIGVVKWGEHGYYKTNYPHNYTREIVEELNTSHGVDTNVAEAMVICSMVDGLEETDEAWQKHFDMILDDMEKKS